MRCRPCRWSHPGSPGGPVATRILARRRCREKGRRDSRDREPEALPMAGCRGGRGGGRCLWELERREQGSPGASERTQLLTAASRWERKDLSCLEPAALWPGARTATGHRHAQGGRTGRCSPAAQPAPGPDPCLPRESIHDDPASSGARGRGGPAGAQSCSWRRQTVPWRPAWATLSGDSVPLEASAGLPAAPWTACPPAAAGAGLAAPACDRRRRQPLGSICDLRGTTAQHE